MELKAKNSVEYSEDFFSAEMVDWLVAAPEKAEVEKPPLAAVAGETDPAKAIDSAWSEAMQDPELAAAITLAARPYLRLQANPFRLLPNLA